MDGGIEPDWIRRVDVVLGVVAVSVIGIVGRFFAWRAEAFVSTIQQLRSNASNVLRYLMAGDNVVLPQIER
jgi:hypothetical protein